MKNFSRALSDAFRYWPLLLVATLCSVCNGAIWGLNIGALFPVIEVTIAGDSMQQWIADEISEGERRVAGLEHQLDENQAMIAVVKEKADIEPDETTVRNLTLKTEQLKARRDAELAGVASSRRMKPYIDRYLPNDPFKTVMYVMAGVMICTGLKHFFQFCNTALVALVSARIMRRIQGKIFSKALQLDQTSFAGYSSSGFVAHITHTTGMLSGGVTSVFGGAPSANRLNWPRA